MHFLGALLCILIKRAEVTRSLVCAMTCVPDMETVVMRHAAVVIHSRNMTERLRLRGLHRSLRKKYSTGMEVAKTIHSALNELIQKPRLLRKTGVVNGD